MKERDNTSRSKVVNIVTKKRKPLMTPADKKRQKDSYTSYNIYTGGDDAS